MISNHSELLQDTAILVFAPSCSRTDWIGGALLTLNFTLSRLHSSCLIFCLLESGRQLGVTEFLTHSQLTFVLLPFLLPLPSLFFLSTKRQGQGPVSFFSLRHSLLPRSKLSINELSVSFYVCQCLPDQAAFLQESLVGD